MTVLASSTAIIGGWLLLGASALALGGAPEPPEPDASGTYDIRICSGPCSFSALENVLVRGVLVLEKDRFDKSSVPEPARSVLDHEWYFVSKPRGCFLLETIRANRTYAGLTAARFTSWSWREGKVRFNLYSLIDAWHDAEVDMTSDGFAGKGYSWGVGGAAPGWPADVVMGKRIGPADRNRCIDAAVPAVSQ